MAIEHPYENLEGGCWIAGNLHTHTTSSDGERDHQEVIDDYARRGHGYLAITDHDIFTGGEEYAEFEAGEMVLIPGNEVTANGPHMLHIGASGRIEPHPDRQEVIDAAAAGFVVFNHPNWFDNFNHCPQELLSRCEGYAGLEIYNGVISFLEGSPYATDRWDMLLGAGRRVWGFANDDSHAADGNTGLGWNVVYVDEVSVEKIVQALRSGRFYPSTGVQIEQIEVRGRRITVATSNAQRIVALANVAKRFAHVDGPTIEVEVPEGARYVRFECWGAGETFAWTQPFFVTD